MIAVRFLPPAGIDLKNYQETVNLYLHFGSEKQQKMSAVKIYVHLMFDVITDECRQ